MPGHWLLAQMGKRTLRPGGRELTERMPAWLDIQTTDNIVEFTPGLGATARAVLQRSPASYTGIDRDETAERQVGRFAKGEGRQCLVARDESTGLPGQSDSAVYGEAMLTMQDAPQKERIVQEAARVLRPGGRYGIHDLCLHPDDLGDGRKSEISDALSESIHVGARPLAPQEWTDLLEGQGFTVRERFTIPMHLLEPRRLLKDEGIGRTIGFFLRVVRNRVARQRIKRTRTVFRKYENNMAAMALVAPRN